MPTGGVVTVALDVIDCDDAVATRSDLTPGAYARMRVSDTGIGMARDVKEKAFDPFFTTKDVGKGSGLGLSMVFGFAKQSGGTVELDSAPGCGTTLTILLPRSKAAALPIEPAPKPEEPAPATGPISVLVVEDDPLVRTQVVLSIRSLGYDVIAVENGPAALAELEQGRKVDLLFTDIVMPGGMTGHDLAVKASAARPGLRVLFTSGFPDSAEQKKLDMAIRLLAKPYRRADLARALREALEGRPSDGARVPPPAVSNG
jgi:CheY-like chemotaxis protein